VWKWSASWSTSTSFAFFATEQAPMCRPFYPLADSRHFIFFLIFKIFFLPQLTPAIFIKPSETCLIFLDACSLFVFCVAPSKAMLEGNVGCQKMKKIHFYLNNNLMT
jgi:hypothetical protein